MDIGVAVPVNNFDKETVGTPGSVDPVSATAAVLEPRDDVLKDVVEITESILDSWVAAPGPLPNAGTEPTCLVGEGAAADCSYCKAGPVEAVGASTLGFDVVWMLSGAVVAAPAPSPNAGTEPTCLEADGVCEPSLRCAVGGASEVELRKRGLRRPLYRIRPAATVLDSTASSTRGCRCIFS